MSKRSGESLEQERPQKKRCEKELDPPPMTLRLLDEEWRTLEEEFRSVKPLSACSKDRFVDIAPVRETLCVLNGGSYINANRVELEGLSFVATQEPLPVNFSPELTETENDFWSLIWEQMQPKERCFNFHLLYSFMKKKQNTLQGFKFFPPSATETHLY
eukprot:TRINITY_DN1527_c0_g1_i3.p1 TRINITY_DN1527_c0_g1~~TRINITY_DN1527_c0_g1_i3.p1  ORF type:complete len:159 (+),score=15.25 TRINITY_DN1527_c0_g1_i3:16-492(+)